MTWKRSRHGLASNMTLPSPVIQKIALYIQDSSDFFAFLTCFDDESLGESLGELRHFLELSKYLNPTDLWPKIQLRQLTPWLAPSVRRVASFFTAISVFEVYDVSLLRKCLHPHNIVDLVITPSDNADRAWLTAPFSMLPVQHITFQSPDYWTGDLFVEQMLGSMPNLVSLTLRESYMHVGSRDRLFAFIQASSKLTRLSLSSSMYRVGGRDLSFSTASATESTSRNQDGRRQDFMDNN
ncbi:unnamed protein product [Aphanomyces euteiches]